MFRRGLRGKAENLRQHEEVGVHKFCGAHDLYTAMHEQNVVLEKETSAAIGMLAKAFLVKKKEIAGSRIAVSLGMKGDETQYKVSVGETGESFSTQPLDDTAARRVMFSLARKKYEHMVSVDGIAKFEDDD